MNSITTISDIFQNYEDTVPNPNIIDSGNSVRYRLSDIMIMKVVAPFALISTPNPDHKVKCHPYCTYIIQNIHPPHILHIQLSTPCTNGFIPHSPHLQPLLYTQYQTVREWLLCPWHVRYLRRPFHCCLSTRLRFCPSQKRGLIIQHCCFSCL